MKFFQIAYKYTKNILIKILLMQAFFNIIYFTSSVFVKNQITHLCH
ncbi:hypothetical protein EZS27_020652 [termite gut metagenome]|uniref:Uncharacterized protein n=1 Tax=termite gut metagenome TaxID=433724 RepID=A0A5J4RAG3_9ZZZZ